MRYNSSEDSVGVGHNATSQLITASEALQRARALLSKGKQSDASEALVRALDGSQVVEQTIRAPLALLLARLLAAQGHLAAAEERLSPVLEFVDDPRIAAHILCARAVELANQREIARALALTSRAQELALTDAEVMAHTEELYTILVPTFVLAESDSEEISDELVTRVFQKLVLRFKAAPNNLRLAHVIALFAEHCATKTDTQILRTELQAAEQERVRFSHQANQGIGEFDMWHWAIRCWVLLAYADGYWQQWHQHLAESRGESEHRDFDLHAVSKAPLKRIYDLHKRLRDMYRQTDSPFHNPERVKRHELYLVALKTESKSAQALTDLLRSVSDQLRASGFVGPTAGIGLLEAIGRSAAIQRFVLQQPSLTSTDTTAATSESIELLRQCLSPFSPMYIMHDLGWTEEVVMYCRRLATSDLEPRRYLTSLLCHKAQAAFDGGSLDDARVSCVEALLLTPESREALEIFAAVSDARVQKALDANRTNFTYALALAREDLAYAPDDERLKAAVANVLRRHAQHLRDLLGDSTWSIADARRIWALQNEAWLLNPDSESVEWTVSGSVQLVIALTGDIETTTASALQEVETVVNAAEHMFAGNPRVTGLRVRLLRARVIWHLLNDERIAQLRNNTRQIEALASQVEQAWGLDRERDEDDREWVAFCFARLARACLPDSGWPVTLTPYDTGLSLVTRGLRIVPGNLLLTSVQAELLRIKANAIIGLGGGFDGATLSEAAKRSVIELFSESWKLDASDAERALAIGRACATIGQYAASEWYAHAAMMLDPTDAAARDFWALMRAQPTYEAAVRDSDYAGQLINQNRYRDAVAYLTRAEQTLARVGYNPAWETFVDLHRVIRHNLDVLHRSGY